MNIIGLEVLESSNSGVAVAPPGKIEITYGQTLRILTGFDYRGAAKNITLYGAIGERRAWIIGGFVEKISAEAPPLRTPDSPTAFVPVTASVNIPITADIAPGTDYDIYCKIKEHPEAGLPEVDDVITITGIPPTYELLEETIYPYSYIYDGDAEVSTFTFKTDPFTPASWIAGRLADHFENEVRNAGGRVMEMRVYVDRSPLLWADWRIEVVGISPKATAGLGMSLGLVWWAAILVVAFAIIAVIIVVTLATKTIVGLFKRKVGLEDVKVGWKKDTLIKTIQDAEEYWERTPTPIATLEEMSEEDLRHLLNEIVREEVAPPVEGLGLAIAAAAVLGLGVLALGAYAISQPREIKKK